MNQSETILKYNSIVPIRRGRHVALFQYFRPVTRLIHHFFEFVVTVYVLIHLRFHVYFENPWKDIIRVHKVNMKSIYLYLIIYVYVCNIYVKKTLLQLRYELLFDALFLLLVSEITYITI